MALLLAAPAMAQFQPANHFPSVPDDDGKFLALAGTRFATLSSGSLSFALVVPPSTPESSHPCEAPLSGECIYLGIFDGDTAGMSADPEALADYNDLRSLLPSLPTPAAFGSRFNHWDNLTAGSPPTVSNGQGTQLGFALFADPNQVASTKKKNLLGAWLGDRTDNLSRDDVTDPRWIAFAGDFEDPGFTGRGADLTSFPDNGWWNLEIELDGCAVGSAGCPLSATGANSFHLCIFYNPDPSTYPAALSGLLAGYGDEDEVVELCSDIFDPTTGKVRPDSRPRTVSNFKLKGETDIQLLSRSFAFEGGQHNFADTSVLIPGWSPLDSTSTSPSYDAGFFVGLAPCDPVSPTPPCWRYDSNWVFNVFLPATNPRRELVLFDGDFDYGTAPALGFPPGEVGFPSGELLAGCDDTSDPDAPASPAFVAALGPQIACTLPNNPVYGNLCVCADLPPGVTSCSLDGSIDQDAKPQGNPPDDNLFDQFRHVASPDPAIWPAADRKCVVYEVRSPGPNGVLEPPGDPASDDLIYRNPNPSSQREWERFRIVSRCELTDTDPAVRQCGCSNSIASLPSCPPGFPPALEEVFDPTLPDAVQADVVVNDDRLAIGTWRVTVYGVDLSNLNAWATELQFCPADNPFCNPPLPPYKVGDTVWNDTDLDGKQDFDEGGLPGVKVNLIEAGQALAMKQTGDEDLDTSTSCEDCNTGGDPSGPADPAIKTPVDEEGLFCFDVEIPPPPGSCSVTTAQQCIGDGDCPSGETCLPPPPANRCSVTTSQPCIGDADCPGGETCTVNCRDFVVEVDGSNFDVGGALDGFGPTTPSPQTDCQVCEAEGGAVTLNCDFGYAPCDECDGKVSALTLRYLGGSSAQIQVDQKNGTTVFGPATVDPDQELTLGPGNDKGTYGTEIFVYVDGSLNVQIHTSCSQPIGPGLVFGDFEVVRGASKNGGAFCPAQCRPTPIEDLEIQDDEVKWRIENAGNTPITVSRVVLEWPVEKGNLKKLELDGTFYEQLVAPPTADISSGFVADVDKRTLDPGEDKDLKLRFDQKFETGSYFVRVEFGDESCAIETSGTACVTSCDKPIHDLTMIWNGTETVDVTAWKGPVGSTSLGTQTVAPGERVTFGDFDGAPNDVFWEIFLSGTHIKLGESKFHLSCSDDDLDGAEDCGKPQGDGKDDDPDLLNDWIFDGWRDKDETLSCTPVPICEPSDPPPGDVCVTDCEKPIHDLSMIWNGTQTVNVTAWKGAVGSTSLGTQTAAPGDRITFGDFAGSPNDVFWEIFALNGTKLGESKFHLSCSDDDLDGADDCGKPQGNGKDNDSDFLNDWIFDGWRDDDETLSCSPEPVCEPTDPPPSASCETDCEKPIHDLSMIWNGTQTVNVTAWKGPVGSTSLGTQTAAPGDRITFGDFAGSPNDVFWEIFALDGTKLGESKFHLSCSDSEMDGADDCGRLEGNGKDNDSDFINDWIFDGWRDDDELLTCSPEPICEPVVPPPGQTLDCSKPIDALTMVWDGAEAVKIQPWKGSVGSTALPPVDNILPGGIPGTASEVTVAGFSGSPNDVIWEVFRAGTSIKLGESKFHLSCSDSEMNGGEDCGNRQGDGKSNESSLINDWIFEGMVDSDETLDCTP